MTSQQENKKHIRYFFQYYTDERLAALLAHAQNGKLAYCSCCCFIGSATANHALRGVDHRVEDPILSDELFHLVAAVNLFGGRDANDAYRILGEDDESRRRILIPMIRCEMRRRDKLREIELQQILKQIPTPVEVA